jgi:hypothetical protein
MGAATNITSRWYLDAARAGKTIPISAVSPPAA